MSDASRLASLQAERAALLARIAWWENHRAAALVPLAALSFGVGYGLGWALHLLLGWPYQLGYLSAVATMFACGRLLEKRTNPAQLPLLEARIERAARALSRETRESSAVRG